MSSKNVSIVFSSFMVGLVASSSYTALASDQNIPHQGNVTNQYASGATSGGSLPHNMFSAPQAPSTVNKPNVPHMMPPQRQTHNKPIPAAPAGHNPPHDTHGAKPKSVDCPPGSQKGWKIKEGDREYIRLDDGTEIDLSKGGDDGHTHNHAHAGKDETKQETEEERNLKRNPGLSPEDEKIREELEKSGIGSLYDRNGQKEFGKELNGKVYFKTQVRAKGVSTEKWEVDPNVKAKGLSDKNRPSVGKPRRVQPTPSNQPAKKPQHAEPNKVGLTVRTNTAQRNPQTGKVELEQGAANVAQTGLTGGPAPHVDTSETGKAVPPPPPPPPPAATTAAAPADAPAADAGG
jgi:hypothetical protein